MVLFISDNTVQCIRTFALIRKMHLDETVTFDWACTKYSSRVEFCMKTGMKFRTFDLKNPGDVEFILKQYSLVISLHCKQLFPKELIQEVKCINIHPGYNPYNRGWYPQAFSIINQTVIGATIHEIDNELDHGNIIDRMIVPSYSWDTSKEVYERVLEAELILLERKFEMILNNDYEAYQPEIEGNVNRKGDFNTLCKLNLDERNTLNYFLDKLRALSHGDYRNAYYIDKQTGKKVFVRIALKLEE